MRHVHFFVDQTIPGLSPSDLAQRATHDIVVDQRGLTRQQTARRRAAYRRALKGLDRRLLRDIGIDLGSA